MSNYCKFKIKIENPVKNEESEILEFYFAYNKTTRFEDLLEFIAYYFPEKNICPCFRFRAYYESKELMTLDDNWKFCQCFNRYSNFEIFKPDNVCKCDEAMKYNYKKSKIEIIENLTKKSEIIKMNVSANEHAILNKNKKYEELYDIIVDIKSIKDICKGWEIKMSKKAEKEYEKLIKEKVIKIGVIGNANKGKTFLLSKISEMELSVGISTKGLSIKYPYDLEKYTNRRIVLLDSAGLEIPILNDNNQEENILFKEKSREKLITELFMQNYIVDNSDILLIVVGIMTYSEQKLINKIKILLQNLKKRKNIFVIHNLMTLTKMNQVKDYIDNNLLKNAAFKLEEGYKISISNEKKGLYFIEKDDEKIYDFTTYHYIMAQEGSEAGDYFNEFTKNQLNKFFIVARDEYYDAIYSIKEKFIDMSKDILEEIEEPIQMKDFDNTDTKKIKLTRPENLILKRCFTDEAGLSNLSSNSFIPTYNYYKKDNKLIIRVEIVGNYKLKESFIHSGENTIIKIKGIEEFNLDIPLKSREYYLKNEMPTIEKKNGVIILEYEIDEEKVAYYKRLEEEEI